MADHLFFRAKESAMLSIFLIARKKAVNHPYHNGEGGELVKCKKQMIPMLAGSLVSGRPLQSAEGGTRSQS